MQTFPANRGVVPWVGFMGSMGEGWRIDRFGGRREGKQWDCFNGSKLCGFVVDGDIH